MWENVPCRLSMPGQGWYGPQSAAVSDLDTGKATSRGMGRTHGTVAVKLINE